MNIMNVILNVERNDNKRKIQKYKKDMAIIEKV